MSSIRNLKLEVVLAAIDKATKPIKAVMGSSSGLSKQLKDTKDKLKDLNTAQRQLDGFNALKKQAAESTESFRKNQQTLKDYQAKLESTRTAKDALMAKTKQANREYMAQFKVISALANPTAAQVANLQRMKGELEKLEREKAKAINSHRRTQQALDLENTKLKEASAARKVLAANLRDSAAQLDKAGIKTHQLSRYEGELKGKIAEVNSALERQQQAMEKVSKRQQQMHAARSRYERSLETRDRIAGAGATTMAAGSAVGLPIIKMVTDYSSYEDAMLGVARQVEGARDANGKLTRTYYEMGDAIKAMAEKIPMATTEIAALVEGGARMGIKGKADLLAFAKTAALASTAFDLPADQISEDLGKIANTYKIPIKNIEQLGDVINYLDDNAQSKGADIIDVMQRIAGSTGNMNYKEAAALGSTFLSLGASSEVAASATKAMVRELAIAEKQPKRFQAGLKELGLNAKQVTADMARDSTGTILKVMEAVKKLPDAKRMGVMVDLFGKEYGDDAAKLADNLAEYRKQLALVNEAKARGSMGREGDAKNDTLSANWQMTQNKLFNQSSELGNTLRQPLMEVMGAVSNVLASISAWTKANPELTAALVKIAAVIAIVLVAVGSLMLAIAGILGPFIAARFAMSMLWIQLTSGVGFLGRLGSAISMIGRVIAFVGRLFLLNPIGLVITAIAAGAYLIWRNWDTLGPKFSALWDGIKAGASSLWGGIKNAASSAFTAVSSAAASVWANIKQAFSGGILGVSQLIINWSPLGLFYQAFAAVMSYFGVSMPAKFTDFGRNILQGLVNGITSSMGAVKAAITGAGEATISWFKEKLGIHSPSRVFAALGGFTMAGLQQGIDGNQNGPLGAVMNVAKKLTAAGTGIAIGASSGLAGAVPIDTRPPISAARPAATASAPSPITITIQAAPGMNEQQLAMLVAREVERIQRQSAARGRSRLGDSD